MATDIWFDGTCDYKTAAIRIIRFLSMIAIAVLVCLPTWELIQAPVLSFLEAHWTVGSCSFLAGYLVLFAVFYPDGIFRRPHRVFWRLMAGLLYIYLALLIFLLLTPLQSARAVFHFLDAGCGIPLPDRTYAANCALTLPVIWNSMDIFVISHLFGFVAKAFLLRNFTLLVVNSFFFEIVEYSLQHQLANFAECWWDHWILDFALSNFLGIIVGLKIIKTMKMKLYHWTTAENPEGDKSMTSNFLTRAFIRIVPYDMLRFSWIQNCTTFPKYLTLVCIAVTPLIVEVNSFYLKFFLQIPVEHRYNLYRLVIHLCNGCVAFREIYTTVYEGQKSISSITLIMSLTIALELWIIFKWSSGYFNQEMPRWAINFWLTILGIIVSYPIGAFINKPWLRNNC